MAFAGLAITHNFSVHAVITSSSSTLSSISTQQCCDTSNVVTTAVVEVSTATEKMPTYIAGILSSSQDTINIYHISLEKTTIPPTTSSILSETATLAASILQLVP